MRLPTQCPLGHEPVQLVENVSTRQLVSAYRSLFRLNIATMLGGLDEIAFCRCDECGLLFFYPPTPGPPSLYAELARIPCYYAAEKEEYRLAARRINAGQRVLEAGCGTGRFTRYLPEPNYVGLEFNTGAVKTGLAAGLDIRGESIETFARNNKNGFDAVCAFQVLEHVPDPASFIRACVACARPGGLVMFGVPNSDGYLGVQPDEILNMPPHHITWWAESVFWYVASQFGLEVVAVEAERLNDRDLYFKTVALRALMKFLKIKRYFLFYGPRYVVTNWVANRIGKVMAVPFSDTQLRPVGHTMLAVLRKLPSR